MFKDFLTTFYWFNHVFYKTLFHDYYIDLKKKTDYYRYLIEDGLMVDKILFAIFNVFTKKAI